MGDDRVVATRGISAVASRDAADVYPVRLLTGDAALDLLDRRWDDLLAKQALPNAMLSSCWLRALARWRTGTPLVAVAEEDGRIVAGAALELRGGGLGPRAATWLGPVEQQFSPDALEDPERPGAAEAVFAAVLGEVGLVSVGAPAAGPAARALAAVAPWRTAAVTGERWLLPWPAPRLDYARKRSAYELRRAERQGVEIELRAATDRASVQAALVRLFRVHRDRWRDRPGETPRFATTAAHRRWNLDAVGELADRGQVRLVELLEDGRLVAGNLGFVHGCGGLGHTQAIRPGVMRDAGHALMLGALDALASGGATAFDLGVSSGQAGGPKARLGATADPIALIAAASSPRRQRAYETGLHARRAARRLRTRAAWRP